MDTSVCYSTLDEAVRLIKPGSFLAKLDLSSAYRSIPIHRDSYPLTGIQWTFSGNDKPTYMYDARLPFGAGMACSIFQTLSYAVVRMMLKRNFHVVSYIDDFLCVEDDEKRCLECHECLQELLRGLGYVINMDKTEAPNQVMSFLGVSINCLDRTLSLPEKKLLETKDMIRRWSTLSKCTKRELQSLIGRLNWCARVVHGGRTFMRELINLLPRAKEPYHHIRLSRPAKNNILWWKEALVVFHGNTPFCSDIPLPTYVFATDACMKGGGAHFYDDWCYVNWELDLPQYATSHINVLELEMVHQSAVRWGRWWSGTHVCVRSDNSATIAAVNKGSSKSRDLMVVVERLFWLSILYNFKLSAVFLSGVDNILADRISRLHELNSAFDAQWLITNGVNNVVSCVNHMSHSSYVSLQEGWRTPLVAY